MGWSESNPSTTSKINEIPGYVQDNLDAIEDMLGAYHSSLASAASGTHTLGINGFAYDGSTAGLTALSGVGSGALAFDTTVGAYKIYSGSSWVVVGTNQWSRVRAYSSLAQTFGNSPTTVIFGTETYDTLSEFDTSTGVFTALASGGYIVGYNITMETSGSNARDIAVDIQKNSTSYSLQEFPINGMSLSTDSYQTANGMAIVTLAEGDTIRIRAYHGGSQTHKTLASSIYTYVFIHRIGGQGF